jgi:hypothetical protein
MLDYHREVARCDATSDGDAGDRGHQGRRRGRARPPGTATRASAATTDGDVRARGRGLPEMAARRVFLG